LSTPADLRDAGIAAREHAADPRLLAAVEVVIEKWADSGREFSANEIREDVPAIARDLVAGRLRSFAQRKVPLIVWRGEVQSSLHSTHGKKIGRYIGAQWVAPEAGAA